MQLETYLYESGTLPRSAIDRAVARSQETGESLSNTLITEGLLTADELRRIMSHIHGIPFVRLHTDTIETQALYSIPEPFARAHSAVAYHETPEGIEVALLDVDDITSVQSLSLPRKLLPRLTDAGSMKTALLIYQKELRQKFGDAIAKEAQLVVAPATAAEADIIRSAKALSVSNLVDLLIEHAIANKASAIHIDTRDAGLLIRYRIGKRLCDAMLLPSRVSIPVMARLKLLAKISISGRAPGEGVFSVSGTQAATSISVSAMFAAQGERLVIHLTPKHTGRDGFTLEALGFSGQALERTHDALQYPNGLVLVCGEAQSGKTTTLYTLLDCSVAPDRNTVSVEHDVECRLKGVAQFHPNKEAGLSYVGAIRAALKQDPDVLMLSSIDDQDAAELAVSAANRGILVIAGMTAPSAAGAALLSQRVPSNLLAAVLRASIGVSRVKKLCDKHNMDSLTRAQLRALEENADPAKVLLSLKKHGKVTQQETWKGIKFGSPLQCQLCEEGYAGFLGLQEVFVVDEEIKEALRGGISPEDLETMVTNAGMLSMVEDGIAKAIEGRTTLEEVLM